MGNYLADVVAAAAEDSEDRVSGGPLERAAGQAAIRFHVADLGLDCAAAAQEGLQSRRQSATLAGDQDLGSVDAVTTVAAVDDGQVGPPVSRRPT